jgi:putative membrane protein
MSSDSPDELLRENKVLWPLSNSGVRMWRNRSEQEIREALAAKVVVAERQSRGSEASAAGKSMNGKSETSASVA